MNDERQVILDRLLAVQRNWEDLLAVEDFLEDLEEFILQRSDVDQDKLSNVRRALQEARNGALEAERATNEARTHWDAVRPRGANYGR